MLFSQWGELAFHRWLEERFGTVPRGRGIGEDAALLPLADGFLALTSDAVVEGVHFRREWFAWAEIGRRAAYACLSDLAAVCAQPRGMLLSLGVPPDLPAEAVQEMVAGLAKAGEEFGAPLLGGDTTAAAALFADLMAVGHSQRPWWRTTAQAGDVLVVTGALGGPAAALELLQAGRQTACPAWPTLRARLATPTPRVREALALAALPVHAAIDISDGLLLDAGRLAQASGLRAVLRAEHLPTAPGVREAAALLGRSPLEFTAAGGEEYELLLALPAAAVAQATQILAALSCALTTVGHLEAGRGVVLLDAAGQEVVLPRAGWEHYAPVC
jgi:thiamine-monophosphate kinase